MNGYHIIQQENFLNHDREPTALTFFKTVVRAFFVAAFDFFGAVLAFVLACRASSTSEVESSIMTISVRFRFPVPDGDVSISSAAAFVLDLEERVETAAAGGLGALFGGMVEDLWIGVVRVLVVVIIGVRDKEVRGMGGWFF